MNSPPTIAAGTPTQEMSNMPDARAVGLCLEQHALHDQVRAGADQRAGAAQNRRVAERDHQLRDRNRDSCGPNR